MSGYYYTKNKKPNNQSSNSDKDKKKAVNQVSQLKKTDFKYNQQSKVRNLIDDEEDIGEVGEWVEKTANVNNNNGD